MRRAPAILLVVLFSFSLIAPALFVDTESHLPACCRPGGKHHCAMMDREMMALYAAAPPSSGLAVNAVRIKCPLFPNGGVLLPHSGAALVATTQPGVSIVSQVETQVRAEAGYRISFNRSHQKRGPPCLLS